MNLPAPSKCLLQLLLLLMCVLHDAVGTTDESMSFSYKSHMSSSVNVGRSENGFVVTPESKQNTDMTSKGGKMSTSKNNKGPNSSKIPTLQPSKKKRAKKKRISPSLGPTSVSTMLNPFKLS